MPTWYNVTAMDNDCIFCKIAAGEIPADKVYEDDLMVCFKDVNPRSPVHLLLIPKKHIPTLNSICPEDSALLGEMVMKASEIAAFSGISDDGYRVVVNCNRSGGQEVYHLHIHIMGGRDFSWPPG